MVHKDPVTPELRERIFIRDQLQIYLEWRKYRPNSTVSLRAWLSQGSANGICVAVLVDWSQFTKCSGRLTLDHIKDQPRMGKRAPSDEYHLVTVCEAHSENGAKAGYQWNTAHRAGLREYLARFRPAETDEPE